MRRTYVIEVIFNLCLLTLFVLCTFVIVTFGANGYQQIVSDAQSQDENRIALSYLATKLRQCESQQSAEIVQIEGKDCLKINEDDAMTLIYYDQGNLFELYAGLDAEVLLSDAEPILEIAHLSMKQEESYFVFEAENALNQHETLTITLR